MTTTFRLKSHIDVVLVGDKTVSLKAKSINPLLDHITSLSSNNLVSVSERVIYNVIHPINENLLIKLRQLESSQTSSFTNVENVISEDYTRRLTQSVVLYVIFASAPAEISQAPCPRRGFISNKYNFAWIYGFSSQLTDIIPHGDHIEVVNYPSLQADINLLDLSTLIVRSAESLIPFPSDDVFRFNSIHLRTIEILTINLCFDVESRCPQTSTILTSVISQLQSTYSGYNIQIIQSSIDISLKENIDILHALEKSSKQLVDDKINGKETVLDADLLIHWLSMSQTWKNALNKYAISTFNANSISYSINSDVLLPVLSISTVSSMKLWLNSRKVAVAVAIPAISDPWNVVKFEDGKVSIDVDTENLANSLQWPADMVIVVQTEKSEISHLVICDYEAVNWSTTDIGYSGHEIFKAIQTSIWGMIPQHEYFSFSSNSRVRDFNWYSPSTESFYQNFRQSSSLPRFLIIFRLKHSRNKFLEIVEFLNSSNAYSFLNYFRFENSENFVGFKMIQVLTAKAVKKSNYKTIKAGREYIFSCYNYVDNVISAFEDISKSFTINDYQNALLTLKNLDSYINQIESNIEKLTKVYAPKIFSLADTAVNHDVYSKTDIINVKLPSDSYSDSISVKVNELSYSFLFLFLGIVVAFGTGINRYHKKNLIEKTSYYQDHYI